MFSTSKEMIASTPDVKRGMVRVQLRTCLTWVAQRVGGGAQAQAEGPGRPIYNYAPRYYAPRYTAPRYYPPAPLGGEY